MKSKATITISTDDDDKISVLLAYEPEGEYRKKDSPITHMLARLAYQAIDDFMKSLQAPCTESIVPLETSQELN